MEHAPDARDIVSELHAYRSSGPRDERPEILAPAGTSTWIRVLAESVGCVAAVATGYCLSAGSKLLLTYDGVKEIRRHHRKLIALRAATEIAWIDSWPYTLRQCPRIRVRITQAERREMDATCSALGLHLAVVGGLATIAILMQADTIVPSTLAVGWSTESIRFGRELRRRAVTAAEYVRLAQQRKPVPVRRITWDDVLAAARRDEEPGE